MSWQHLAHLPKLVIFGGTFDPIHNGHLALAQLLSATFNTQVLFMPTGGTTPYKPASTTTQGQRIAMIKLAIQAHKYCALETFELDQPQYSCSYDTLKSIRAELGNTLPIYFFIGEDSLITLDTWDNWWELFSLTNFVVGTRRGGNLGAMTQALRTEFYARQSTNLPDQEHASGTIYMLNSPNYDVSSTNIRLATKSHQSIHGMVPIEVEQYIAENNLYQGNTT